MKLLVTGGAGYIGSVVAAQLLEAGHEVVVLDNLERGHRAALPAGSALVEADLEDATATRAALADGFDAVLHFAALALVAESVAQPERYWRTNVGGTDHCAAHGLGAVSLRYFNVAGAAGPHGEDHDPETHIVPNVLRVALGQREHVEVYGTDYPTPDGTAVRDYIHVEDLATAHLLALDAIRPARHAILNLGNGAGFSVNQVVETARRVTGHPIPTVEAPRRPGDPPELVAASQRIRAELGWEPRKPGLEEIVADAWAWHQAHPDGYAA
ncbi:MAG: NAD-dependent epimerase/dehydratase family protein [Actinobacteria bacterium]|nr:MAG: NAD-dependent epimerase/dehydratase family protein [Actinomycetota bacterium]